VRLWINKKIPLNLTHTINENDPVFYCITERRYWCPLKPPGAYAGLNIGVAYHGE
jgi:hypothetical protein